MCVPKRVCVSSPTYWLRLAARQPSSRRLTARCLALEAAFRRFVFFDPLVQSGVGFELWLDPAIRVEPRALRANFESTDKL